MKTIKKQGETIGIHQSEIPRNLAVAAILLAIVIPISLFALVIGFSLDYEPFDPVFN